MKDQFIPYTEFKQLPPEEMVETSAAFYEKMKSRRTIREFSSKAIPMEVIDNCIHAAGSAPSGANQQPWHFVVVSDAAKKKEIRKAAEKEEREFYAGRAGDVWLDTLAPLGTDANKPFLEEAPVLIAIFEQKFHMDESGEKVKHYYAKESTGIATGLLITALHQSGLCTLTHTPSPMNFLNKILDRPDGERPFLLLVVGFPGKDVQVPDIHRKNLDEIRTTI